MPSPFPGMDPFLENPTIWPDLHLELIHATRAALAPQVAPRYYVAVEERAYIAPIQSERLLGRPDVSVVDRAQEPGVPYDGNAPAITARPVTVTFVAREEVREPYLEIRAAENHQVITVIEVLSPSNKRPGEGRSAYEAKRARVIQSSANLVEIDLLRSGEPMRFQDPAPSSHYRLLVGRAWERPHAQLYPFNVNEPFPEIPIPLREGESEAVLNLNQLMAQLYDQARYDLRIDYAGEPDPPLESDWAKWAEALLRRTKP